jgi:hypothetical protein
MKMIKKSLAIMAITILSVQDAQACHRFSRWYYPTPQRCSVGRDKTWFVEVTKMPVVAQPERDLRTPEQINDEEEHQRMVAQHKDELNELLLKLKEDESAVATHK